MTDVAPFDMFKMRPRNTMEFGQAIAYQIDNMDRLRGFGVPHDYVTAATNLMSPDKIIGLLYRYASPVDYRVWYDGRNDLFVIEPYETAQHALAQG